MRYSLHEWVVMLIGLKNAQITFIHTMNSLFSDMLDSGVAVFLDNILLCLLMVKEYSMLLEKVLEHLCHYTFPCKLEKSSFLHNSTIFLGFKVTPDSMPISDLKLWGLYEWLVPTRV